MEIGVQRPEADKPAYVCVPTGACIDTRRPTWPLRMPFTMC